MSCGAARASYQSGCACYRCEGSAAVAARGRDLTLIEGGLARVAADEAPSQKGEPSRRGAREGELEPAQARLALVAAALLVACACLGASLSTVLARQASARSIEALPTASVTVRPGDSLWGIAGECGVDGVPTQDVVAWIEEANGLEGGLIVPGQVLVVPVSS